MAQLFVNNFKSLLLHPITNNIYDIFVYVTPGDGNKAPVVASPDFMLLTIKQGSQVEIVKVTTSYNSLSLFQVVRGQEGTAVQNFSAGAEVYADVTAGTLAKMENALIALCAAASIPYNV